MGELLSFPFLSLSHLGCDCFMGSVWGYQKHSSKVQIFSCEKEVRAWKEIEDLWDIAKIEVAASLGLGPLETVVL